MDTEDIIAGARIELMHSAFERRGYSTTTHKTVERVVFRALLACLDGRGDERIPALWRSFWRGRAA